MIKLQLLRRPFIDELEITEPDGGCINFYKSKGKGLRKWIGELLSCYWCTVYGFSAFLLVLYNWIPIVAEPLLALLAIAGAAAIIETITGIFYGRIIYFHTKRKAEFKKNEERK